MNQDNNCNKSNWRNRKQPRDGSRWRQPVRNTSQVSDKSQPPPITPIGTRTSNTPRNNYNNHPNNHRHQPEVGQRNVNTINVVENTHDQGERKNNEYFNDHENENSGWENNNHQMNTMKLIPETKNEFLDFVNDLSDEIEGINGGDIIIQNFIDACPQIIVKIHGEEFKALIDTGSRVTAMADHVYDNLNKIKKLRLFQSIIQRSQ